MDFHDDAPGFDDEDLGAADLAAAVYGPESVTQEQPDDPRVAGHPFAAELNGVYQGFPYKNAPGPLPELDKARIQMLSLTLARLMRNTNITAALPAHVSPTIWSTPVDLSARVSIPAAAAAPDVWQDIITYTVPRGRYARISEYGYEVDDAAYVYNGGIQFRILVGGRPVPTLDNFVEQRGTPVRPRETVILVPENEQIKFQARRAVAAVGAQDLIAVLVGWTWRLRNTYEGTRAATTAY